MRITTRIVLDFDGNVLLHDYYEYDGPIAEAKGDSTAQAAEASQAAFNSTLQNIFTQQYNNQTSILNFLKAPLEASVKNPQGYTDAELTSMRTGATDTLSAQYQNAQKALNAHEVQNMGGTDVVPSGTQSQLEAALLQSEASDKASADEQITQADANLKQQNYWASVNALNGVAAQVNPLGYANSATAGSGAVSNLSQAVTAANGPGIGSILGGIAGSVGGAAITTFCPAEGSLYLMADGSEQPVEMLVVGDQIMGIDDEPQTIEEIQVGVFNIIRVCTENGYCMRNSLTHAYALPKGGFVVAARSLGKTILTKDGPSRVSRVESAGKARVFNVITDGSHSYRADGVWSLGVGDAERQVSMPEWEKIGDRLFKDRTRSQEGN